MQIKGMTALITGGAVRIGQAITLALASAGANVVINYHSSGKDAEETAVKARALGVQALLFPADISNEGEVENMTRTVMETFGGVDILVNNASLFQTTPVPTSDFTAWRRVTRILVDGAFYCANAFAPEMRRRGRGVIINLIDLSARQPFPRFAAHSVGKAGLEALTRQLALELSPEVRVNAIAPGPVLPPPGYSPEKIARAARHTLLGRWGSPGDVADAVLFLIRSDYITGITLTVDGGEHLARYKDPD